MGKQWEIVTRYGQHMTVNIFNVLSNEREEMEYYDSYEVAQCALTLMDDKDIEKHGAHVREVTHA